MQKEFIGRIGRALAETSMAALLVLSAPEASAQDTRPAAGSSATANPVEVAQELYRQAFFVEAAQSLKVAFATGKVTPDDWVRGNEWLARALVRNGDRLGARAVFRGILDRDPQYRPDPLRTPQDEIDVFNQALADYREWEVRQQRRVPVSLGLYLGRGGSGNRDFADIAQLEGGDERFEGETEFGGSLRFPIPLLSGAWSLDVELGRFSATNFDTLPIGNDSKVRYSASALPLAVSLIRAWPVRRGRLNVFAGGGPLLAAEINMRFLHDHALTDLIPVTLASRATGLYLHGGLELEYPIQSRVMLTARGLVRSARTGELDFEKPNFPVYDPDTRSRIGGRSLDFSGLAGTVGLRAYIGY